MLLLKLPQTMLRATALVLGLFSGAQAVAQNSAPPAPPAPPAAAAFFQRPVFSAAALSPDGTRLAIRVGGPGSRDRLAVLDLASMQVQPVASFADADVDRFRWVNASRLVFTLADHQGMREDAHSAPGLYAVNADGLAFKQLVQRDKAWSRDTSGTSQLMERDRVYKPDNTGTNQPTERERVVGRDGITSTQLPFGSLLFEQTGPQDSDAVFVLMPDGVDTPQGGPYKLARLNTVTGRAEDVDAPVNAVQWLLDNRGELRAVLTARDRAVATSPLTLHTRPPGDPAWRKLRELAAGSLALHAAAPDGTLYALARPGRDTLAVYSLDVGSGQLADKPLLGAPPFDITPEFISSDTALLGLRFTVDAQTTQWFDAGMQAAQSAIDKLLPNTANLLTPPRRGSSPWLLVQAFADVQPAVFYLVNRQTQKLTRLGSAQPGIQAAAMSPMDFVRVKGRDALESPAYLTLPVGAAVKKMLPLIVWVHDGPWQRGATWQWQPEVQFLASRGYAVLQPEFRGSLGFGLQHAAAGPAGGSAGLLADLADAARWAVAQGLADPKRVCVMGTGYGGYLALQALAQDSEVFRCGVAWSAVFEPTAAAEGVPLRAAAARLQRPVLLAHGRLDRLVPISQAQKMVDAVKLHNSQIQWIPYENEGHGWHAADTATDWWSKVEGFLARHTVAAKP